MAGFTKEARVETILREFIADAEERLSVIDPHSGSVHRPVKPPKTSNWTTSGRHSDMTDGTPPRRFPAPWVVDRMPGGYVVRDANGQQLAWVYARATEAEARQANGWVHRDSQQS
jgi:hypothetical protein